MEHNIDIKLKEMLENISNIQNSNELYKISLVLFKFAVEEELIDFDFFIGDNPRDLADHYIEVSHKYTRNYRWLFEERYNNKIAKSYRPGDDYFFVYFNNQDSPDFRGFHKKDSFDIFATLCLEKINELDKEQQRELLYRLHDYVSADILDIIDFEE
jgi:hypothetical protein